MKKTQKLIQNGDKFKMAIIKCGDQKFECPDDNIARQINSYIAQLEEQNLKNQLGQSNSDSTYNLDGSITADGWKYSNPHIAAHVDEVSSEWEKTLQRADRDNRRGPSPW